MDSRETFRILIWQRALWALLGLPLIGALLVLSPVTGGWSRTVWVVAACVGAGAGAAYIWNLWRRSPLILDDEGLTLYLASGWTTWPYEKLLKVRQFGRYRVKMCFDPDIEAKHVHIKIDVLAADAFVDALLDRYFESEGHELPDIEEHEAAA